VVVTATTLLLKSYAQVHDWASKETSLGDQAHLSSWLFSLLWCKMSLILPKHLYGVTPHPQQLRKQENSLDSVISTENSSRTTPKSPHQLINW